MMHFYESIPLWGIMSTRKSIRQYISANNSTICEQLVFCMMTPKYHPQYLPTMICLCMKIQFLNYLCFKNGSEVQKFPAYVYERLLFNDFLETPEELSISVRRHDWRLADDQETIDKLWEKLKRIKALWCHMIAVPYDRPFLSELIYTFDYVMENEQIPMPEYREIDRLHPCNYLHYSSDPDFEAYPYYEIGIRYEDYVKRWEAKFTRETQGENQ